MSDQVTIHNSGVMQTIKKINSKSGQQFWEAHLSSSSGSFTSSKLKFEAEFSERGDADYQLQLEFDNEEKQSTEETKEDTNDTFILQASMLNMSITQDEDMNICQICFEQKI